MVRRLASAILPRPRTSAFPTVGAMGCATFAMAFAPAFAPAFATTSPATASPPPAAFQPAWNAVPVSVPSESVPLPVPALPPLAPASAYLPARLPTHLRLDLSQRQLYVMAGTATLATYPVAVGRPGWETPTGQFQIQHLRTYPAWQHPFTGEVVPPGPTNPLGARWIGFWHSDTQAIGFHGTPQAELIGQAVSHGCVRLRNVDIAALYDQVRLGLPVQVVP